MKRHGEHNIAVLLYALLLMVAPTFSTADEPAPEAAVDADERYHIEAIEIEGVRGDALDIDTLMAGTVKLREQEDFWTVARRDEEGTVLRLDQIGIDGGRTVDGRVLRAIATSVLQSYQAHEIAAMRVRIPSEPLQALTDPAEPGTLILRVTEGRIERIRARQRDEPGADPAEAEGAFFDRMIADSPVDEDDAVHTDRIDRHVYWLNRRPGRRVDATLTPGSEPDTLLLDYTVTPVDPWMVYFQADNTGTQQTADWRQRFGFVHHNLTGADDGLSLEYMTANFDEVHAFHGSYERPVPGLPRTRARVTGHWNRYTASELAIFPPVDLRGEGYGVGGELITNVFQHEALFVDAFAGLRYENLEADNRTLMIEGETDFLIPSFGSRLEHQGETSRTHASLAFETNLSGVAGTDREQAERLGRTDVDRSWWAIRYGVDHSMFLEPLLQPGWGEPEVDSTLAHELKLSLQGQSILADRRVPPAFTRSIGGFHTVRGYPDSFISGDNSIVFGIDYRLHIPRLFQPREPAEVFGKPFRFAPEQPLGPTDWNLAARTFFDVGRVMHNDRLPFEEDQTLMGTGVGLELSIKRNLRARLDWGFALRDAESGTQSVSRGDSYLHASFTLSY